MGGAENAAGGRERSRVPCPARGTRGSESESRAEDEGDRPAGALAVDILQSFLDQPVDIRESILETQLELTHHFDRTQPDEHAGRRAEAERPGLLEELAILRRQSRRG